MPIFTRSKKYGINKKSITSIIKPISGGITIKFRKRKIYISYPILGACLGIFVVTLVLFINLLYLNTKANANISESNKSSNALFININPKFKVEFGDKSNPTKPTVKFSAAPADLNPITGESANMPNSSILDNILSVIKPEVLSNLNESYIEFSLSNAKVAAENVTVTTGSREPNKSTTQNLSELVTSSINSKLQSLEKENANLTDKIQDLKSQINDLVTNKKDIFATTDLIEEKDNKDFILNKAILAGVDAKYSIQAGKGVKEEIIINKLPSYDSKCYENIPLDQITNLQELCSIPMNQYVFDLKLDRDVKVNRSITTTKNNPVPTWYFTDYYGRYLAHIEPPFAYDKNGVKTNNVSVIIEDSKIILTVDIKWLLDPARVYPITIDPNIIHDTQSEFATGTLNRVKDVGVSTTNPQLETYYSELAADKYTVGLWHLNEGTGTTVADRSGNGYTATLGTGTSSPTWVTGTNPFLGSAAGSFDGNDYIMVTSSSIPSFAQGTMEAWIKPSGTDYSTNQAVMGGAAVNAADATTRNAIVALNVGTCSSQWYTIIANGTTSQVVCSTQTYNSTNFPGGVWTHIAITYDGNLVNFYKDGILVGTTEQSVSGAGGSQPFSIGRLGAYPSGLEYNGVIDEVRISNIARSADDIKADASRRPYAVYTSDVVDLSAQFTALNSLSWSEPGVQTVNSQPINAETAFDTTGLVAQWSFNDTSGPTALNVAGTCGTNCNGTLVSFGSTAAQDPLLSGTTQSGWTALNKRWGGGAIMFDGVNDYVSVADTAALDLSTYTVDAWVFVNSTPPSQYCVLCKNPNANTGTNYNLMLYPAGQIVFQAGNGGGSGYSAFDIRGRNNITQGKWTNIVGTSTGSNGVAKLYVNGVLDTTVSISGTPNSNANSISIGARRWDDGSPSQDSFLLGVIDTVRIFNRALSSTEIISNYQAGNIEFQTRTSTDTAPYFANFEEWRPVTGIETVLDNFDLNEESTRAYDWSVNVTGINQNWYKFNSTAAANSDGSSTAGRIPLGTTNKGDDADAFRPSVIYDSSIFKMWYTGLDGARYGIFAATSPDGLSWQKVNNSTEPASNTTGTSGRIPRGLANSGDDEGALYSTVIKDGSTYKMWYTGLDGVTTSIMAATSTDGLTWNKLANTTEAPSNTTGTNGRIPLGASGRGDDASVGIPTVIKDGSVYRMWYAGNDGVITSIFGATSPDGLTWTKIDNTTEPASNTTGTKGRIPIGASGFGDASGVEEPTVIKDDGIYKMTYTGKAANAQFTIFSALSYDGLTWTKIANSTEAPTDFNNTLGRISDGNVEGDNSYVAAGSVLKVGGYYYHWYEGADNTANTSRIYLAVMSPYSIGQTTNTTIKIAGTASERFDVGKPTPDGKTGGIWHFEETGGSGAFYKDSSLNGNSGTPGTGTSAPSTVDGIFGKGLNFDGNDYVTVADNASLNGTNFTISAWIKTTTTTQGRVMVKPHTAGTNQRYSLAVNVSANLAEIRFDANDTSGAIVANNSTVINDGKWHMITGTWDDDTNELKMYTDGRLEKITVSAKVPYTSALDLNIGRFDAAIGATDYFIGTIDEPMVASGARSATEIMTMYDMGMQRHITKSVSTTDLTTFSKVPFYIAADRPGNYINYIVGESPYVNNESDASTLSLFHFDEGDQYLSTNTTASAANWVLNDSQYPLNGTLGNSTSRPEYVQGVQGSALKFDGNDFVQVNIAATHPLNLATSAPVTMEMWVYPIGLSTVQNVVNKGVIGNAGYGMAFGVNGVNSKISIGGYGGSNMDSFTSFVINKWYYVAGIINNSSSKIYINGALDRIGGVSVISSTAPTLIIGSGNLAAGTQVRGFNGIIDELRISNVERTAQEIRQSYEMGKRTHPITIDFAAKLSATLAGTTDGSGLLTNTAPSIDATIYGAQNNGDNLYKDDKIIFKENYNGTEYLAQGTVSSVTSGGAVTVSSWDSGSSFPPKGTTVCGGSNTHCFGTEATVFKWQREYMDLSGIMTGISTSDSQNQRNAITNLTFNITNGYEGRSIFLDDLRYSSPYITVTPYSSFGSTNHSTSNRYVQYRAIISSNEIYTSPNLSIVNIDYSAGPTLSQLMRHGKWFNGGVEAPFWWVN